MKSMSPEELKLRARRVPEEVLTQGDLAVLDELLAADCLLHAHAAFAPGAEGVKQWVRALRRAFPDLCAIVEAEIAEGDLVVQRLTISGTHAGLFCGIPPTGKRASWPLVSIQRLGPDGKCAEHWSSWDQLGVLRQLGVGLAAASDESAT
jgi:steroid delta-isomerase-like uncharacterized protein